MTRPATPIYVHAKVMIVDDRLLRVGSANLNNRSMGFDTECDLALEADPGRPEIAATITRIRDDLLAEHLGVPDAVLADAIRHQGGLGAAIESLRRPKAARCARSPPATSTRPRPRSSRASSPTRNAPKTPRAAWSTPQARRPPRAATRLAGPGRRPSSPGRRRPSRRRRAGRREDGRTQDEPG